MPIVWPAPTHCDPNAKNKVGTARQRLALAAAMAEDLPRQTPLKPWRTVAECIDWSIPCNSIFLTKEQARVVKCRRPLKTPTERRIACGIDRYVLKAKKPFLISLTHQGGERVEPIDQPAATITGAHRGEKALVQVETSNIQHSTSNADMGTPFEPSAKCQHCGEAMYFVGWQCRNCGEYISENLDPRTGQPVKQTVAPIISDSVNNFGGGKNNAANEPMRTQCAEVKGGHFELVSASLAHTAHGEQDKSGKKRGRGAMAITEPLPSTLACQDCALVAAHLTKFTTGGVGQTPTEPLPTITSGSHSPETHGGAASVHGIVAANLIEYHSPKRPGDERAKPVDKPLPVQTVEPRFGLVGATVIGAGGPAYQGKPRPIDVPMHTLTTESHANVVSATVIGAGGRAGQSRPRGADEPIHTLTAKADNCVAAASLVKLRGDNIGQASEEPLATISAGGTHHAAIVAYLAQHNGGFNTNPGHEATEPVSTISAKGSQQQVVTGTLAAYYGTAAEGQCTSEPLRTVTAKERFAFAQCELQNAYPGMTPEKIEGALRVAEFLRKYGVQFEGPFATVAGYVIIDIGMRMLTARELFRAQGFPEDYVIDRAWVVDPKTGSIQEIKLTKEQQIRMCGNSVCPPLAEALVRANSPEMCIWRKSEKKRHKQLLAA